MSTALQNGPIKGMPSRDSGISASLAARSGGALATGGQPSGNSLQNWLSASARLSWTAMSEVTQILSDIERGDAHAAEQLLPLVYAELRRLAALKLAAEKPGQTLSPTALVHEAYLRLVPRGLGISSRTADNYWAYAKAYLLRELAAEA